jgi:hypothetical protein
MPYAVIYGKHIFETRKVYVGRSPMLDSLLGLHILPSASILAYQLSVISYCMYLLVFISRRWFVVI